MIERFEREYQEYHGISADRRRRQVIVLRQFADHAGRSIEDCDANDLRAFLSMQVDRGLHVNTVRKLLNMIRPYYSWAWEVGLIDAERLMRIKSVSAPRGANANGLPRPYTRKELDAFRAQLAARWPEVDQKWWDRWRRGTSRWRRVQTHAMRIQIEAIVALALYCGLRRNEIFSASIDDIHYDNAYVVVAHGKGGRTREVPHTASSREAVRRWLEVRAELHPRHRSPWLSLAYGKDGGPMRKPMRWDRFRKLLLTIGDWQLHRFRHTAGTEWLRAIKRVEIVSRLLGHANISQTMGYAAIIRDDLQDAMAKAELEFEERVAA